MCAQLREFKNYTIVDALLVVGLSTALFVIGGIFVEYGATGYLRYVSDVQIPYFRQITIVWLVGVLLMIAGLLGYAFLLRLSIFKLLKRKP